jgi:hypothetical protein
MNTFDLVNTPVSMSMSIWVLSPFYFGQFGCRRRILLAWQCNYFFIVFWILDYHTLLLFFMHILLSLYRTFCINYFGFSSYHLVFHGRKHILAVRGKLSGIVIWNHIWQTPLHTFRFV